MKLNASKTKVLCLGKRNTLPKLPQKLGAVGLNDDVVSTSEEAKNLGVILERHASFEKHALSKGFGRVLEVEIAVEIQGCVFAK